MRPLLCFKLAVSALFGFVLGTMMFSWRPDGCLSKQDGGIDIQKKGCVCEREQEILPRVGQLNTSRAKPISTAIPVAPPESEATLLREFLYPSNKTPVLDAVDQQYKPGSLLRQEYMFKKMVFVGVLTQQAYLSTRAKYLYETWGKEMDELIFFVGEDCLIPPDLEYLPIVKLEGIEDNVYPPLRKTFAVMQYMYDNYLDQFNWFIRADDDMYIRTEKLKELLRNMVPHEKVYLGRAGTGRKGDLGRLQLLPHERYCMGGPGIILSVAAVRELGPHLAACLKAGKWCGDVQALS
jgi:hypothetical protein